MNKPEFISAVAEKSGETKKSTEAVYSAIVQVVQDELVKGEKIQLLGFGNFEISERSARSGRNPQTGEKMTIPASRVPKFRPGKALKEAVNTPVKPGKKKKKAK